MGCDIHVFPEVKIRYGWGCVFRYESNSYRKDRWPSPDRENYFAFSERNYYLFGRLAGVRRESVMPMSEPRGLPVDLSDEVAEFMKNEDYHSKSYYLLSELLSTGWSKPDKWPLDPYEDFRAYLERLKEIDRDPSKVRIVFGFDN